MLQDYMLLKGKDTRARILSKVRANTDQNSMGRLVSIMIGDTPEVAVYVRNQARAADQAGVPFDQQVWPADITQDDAKARITAMNDDADVVGIILQRPVPDHTNVRSL